MDVELSEDNAWPWDDWRPDLKEAWAIVTAADSQTSVTRLGEEVCTKEHDIAAAGKGVTSDGDDSDGRWDAAQQVVSLDEESDDDWAPQTQGAADVKQSEQEALVALLRPQPVEPQPFRYETQQDAEAAGRLLQELRRPPTIAEAKAELPRGPEVDIDSIPEPAYRHMTEDEAIEFVERGAIVNSMGMHGRSSLHSAANRGFPRLIKALCDAGGEVEARDNYGETPLLLLAHCGPVSDATTAQRSECIQAFLSCGADVHAVNPRGRGVLHLACTENDAEALETFIEGLADINARDLAGFTPLMWAAGRNGAESVKMLLDYGADMYVKADRGQTAQTFALTNGCDTIVDILDRHSMLLDAEEARRLKEQGEHAGDEDLVRPELALQLPRPAWACRHEAPHKLEPYQGKRIYVHAKPDKHSNVYVRNA